MVGPPSVDFFFYGTLRDAEVRRIVLGARADGLAAAPAAIRGYRCAPVEGGRFPALVPEAGARADGVVVAGVDLHAAARVSFFEGEGYDYRAAPVEVETAAGLPRAAWAYLSAGGLATGAGRWSIAAWRRGHRRAFVANARRAMARCRGAALAEHEAAWRARAGGGPQG